MEITLPVIPAGVLTLLAFFAPYAIALINHPGWKAGSKRLVAIVVSIALAIVVMVLYYLLTGDVVPQWPVMIILAIIVVQAAYTRLYQSATNLEGRHGTGAKDPQRAARR